MDEEEYEDHEEKIQALELRLDNLESFFKHFVMSFKKNKNSEKLGRDMNTKYKDMPEPKIPDEYDDVCPECNGSGLGKVGYDDSGDPFISICKLCRGEDFE